jgi:hypothetical protein
MVSSSKQGPNKGQIIFFQKKKDNLFKRGIILQPNSQLCVVGCSVVESVDHVVVFILYLVRFGTLSSNGLVFVWLIYIRCWITLFGLGRWMVTQNLLDHLYI